MAPVGKDTRLFVSGEIKEAVEAASWRWKALDIAMKVAFPILLGISAWTGTTIMNLDKRVEIIEATRYSRKDARDDRDEIKDVLRDIKVLLARQEASVDDLKKGLEKLEKRLDSR